ncbi:hypothetical protein DV711_04730 [Motiliproteus coralliicola]|uniref:Uncharacterized protein n=1 Tax=Motiliproteus coralliicola TaxID=2283196 RepID=A0A369WT75_9GAMM|nr:hypothetical protein [Motiliproteus coralliicola]RDE24892.1 hypothetical protein DV711_04730 [Motiliproteus coralliicola]
MPHQHATDFALATDGYFFSTEPFHQHDQIEAIQLACLLASDTDHQFEVILEADALDSRYQLALTGELRIEDQNHRAIDQQLLRELPIEELRADKLQQRGYRLVKQPRFCWMKQQQPIGQPQDSISVCAAAALDSLRQLLSQNRAA